MPVRPMAAGTVPVASSTLITWTAPRAIFPQPAVVAAVDLHQHSLPEAFAVGAPGAAGNGGCVGCRSPKCCSSSFDETKLVWLPLLVRKKQRLDYQRDLSQSTNSSSPVKSYRDAGCGIGWAKSTGLHSEAGRL